MSRQTDEIAKASLGGPDVLGARALKRAIERELTRPIAQLENDILIDILRKGRIEVIDGWDDRLDREIYESRGHAELVRAFVPLRVHGEAVGVLEVGYRRAERARRGSRRTSRPRP